MKVTTQSQKIHSKSMSNRRRVRVNEVDAILNFVVIIYYYLIVCQVLARLCDEAIEQGVSGSHLDFVARTLW